MIVLILSLILFYSAHSFLASLGVKQWAAMQLNLVRWYRLFYSLVSLALLGLIVQQLVRHPYPMLIGLSFGVQLGGLVLLLLGIGLAAGAVMRFGVKGFLGLQPEMDTGLVRSGIHGHVRHPIYTGIILAALGWAVLTPTLPVFTSIVVTFIYLPIGIHLEERKLIAQFGERYIRYRNEVPALFPLPKAKGTTHQH